MSVTLPGVPAAIVVAWLALVNTTRATVSAPPLTNDPALAWFAQWRAEQIVATGQFGHTLPDGGLVFDVLSGVGYPYQLAGENLGACMCAPDVIEAALEASPSHRANVLEPRYHRVGLGVAQAQSGESTYVQLFAD